MKNILFFLLLLFVISCSKQKENEQKFIFTSNYPLKLIIQEIVGDSSLVVSIIPPGVSEHTFEPKVSDIAKLESSLLFLYASDNLDSWVTKKLSNKIELIKLLPKEKILYYDKETPDPHFWTSPRTIIALVDSISLILANKMPQNKENLERNSALFKKKLLRLDQTLDSLLAIIKGKTIFLFHPSFLYFIRDYGLTYGGSVEVIPGSEPTPSHLSELIKKIQETNTKAIFTEPQLNPHSAKVLASNANVKLYEIDPLGAKNVNSYEEFVLKNAKTLVEALK